MFAFCLQLAKKSSGIEKQGSESTWDFNMTRIGIDLKIIAIVLMCVNVTEINGESSGGFRGNVMETIAKSRHKIVHTIEVRVNGKLKVSVPSSSIKN